MPYQFEDNLALSTQFQLRRSNLQGASSSTRKSKQKTRQNKRSMPLMTTPMNISDNDMHEPLEYSRHSLTLPTPHTSFIAKYQVPVPTTPTTNSRTNTTADHPISSFHQYTPTEWDVVCGRGKGSYNRPGNKRFRAIVQEHVQEYCSAISKLDKTCVLNRILHCVQAQNQGQAIFCKLKLSVWYCISDDMAREKCGHAIREAIQSAEHQKAPQTQHAWKQKHSALLTHQQSIFSSLVE